MKKILLALMALVMAGPVLALPVTSVTPHTVGSLPNLYLPVQASDTLVISRDGVVLSRVTVGQLAAALKIAPSSSLTASFTQPAVNGSITISVPDSTQVIVPSIILMQTGGYYNVTAAPNQTSLTVTNTGNGVNAAPGTTIPVGSTIIQTGP